MRDPYVLFNGGLVRSRSVPHLKAAGEGYLYSPMYRPSMVAVDFWLDEHWRFGAYIWKGLYIVWERISGRVAAPSTAAASRVRLGEDILPLLNELGQVVTFARQHKTKLIFLLIAGQDRDGTFSSAQKAANSRLLTWCKVNEITCVEVLSIFESQASSAGRFRFQSDPHWSPLAHEIAANELSNHFHSSASNFAEK